MARKKKNDGFSFEDIVSTDFQYESSKNDKESSVDNININDKVNINDDINNNVNVDNDSDILEKLKGKDDVKVKTLIYLEQDVANHLDYYGDMLGKKNGGKSKFSNESIKNFLKENSLWDAKIANKKKKK